MPVRPRGSFPVPVRRPLPLPSYVPSVNVPVLPARRHSGRAWRMLAPAIGTLLAACADSASAPTTPRSGPVDTPTPAVANVAPTAQFAVSPRYPAPGDTVTFDARYSHDNDGQVVQYRWAASNGVTETTGAVARMVFRTAGTYAITLTALDDRGDSSSTTLSLAVATGGAPSSAVSATQSRLTLAASTVTGGAGVVATVTARTSAGVAISAATVGVSAIGLRVRATPVTGTSNGSGLFTSTLSSGSAQTVIVRAIANFTALTDTAVLIVGPAAAASVSSVRLTQTTLASAADSALLEVTARDTAGNPVPNIAVSVSGSPLGLTVSNEGLTDANGRRIVTLKTPACGLPFLISVVAGGVTLTTTPTLTPFGVTAYAICGPTIWLDATDLSTFALENTTRITEWRDKSGNALHASAASGSTARPRYDATGFSGLPAVTFTGGASNTATPEHLSLAGYPAQGLTAVTYFAVYRRNSTTFCDRLFDFGSSTSVHIMFTPNCGVQRYTLLTTTSGGEISASATVPAVNAGQMLTIVHSGSALLRVNGATLVTSAAMPAPSAIGTPTNRWLGRSQYAADGYLSGQIAEFLAYPRALSNLEYAAVERALMLKWGLGTLTITQGNNQSATAGTSPTSGLGIKLADASGNGIAGATLTLQVTTGGARLSGSTTLTLTTDANGNASVPVGTWILDYGTNTMTVWLGATVGQGQSIAVTGTGTLPANLAMQYDASDDATLYRASSCTGTLAAVGDSVGCWKDNTTNARHATQATAANRPTVTTFGSTGRAALQFVKTRENYLSSTAIGLGNLGTGSRTIVAVATANTTENSTTNDASAIVAFPDAFIAGLGFSGYPNVSAVYAPQVGLLGVSANPTLAYTPNTAAVLSQVVSNGLGTITSTVGLNGTTSSATALGLTLGYSDLMRIGQAYVSPTTSYRWRLDGKVAEIMVFSRSLSNAERLQVERYMGWKWGVTVP